MSDDYTREKLYSAVQSLAVEPGRIQERMAVAARALNVGAHRLSHPDRQRSMDAIEAKLTADTSNPSRGAIATTCAGLSDDDASAIAGDMCNLLAGLERDFLDSLREGVAKAQGAGSSIAGSF